MPCQHDFDRLVAEAEAQAFSGFYDIGALVYYLKVVEWQVPGFSVEQYDAQLRRIHEHIQQVGSFTVNAHRFFIDAMA